MGQYRDFEYAIRKFDEETWHKLDYPDQFRLLIVDGHSSHESLNTITYCQEHKIILFVLPSHCTHALQPLDVVLFSPLKQSWAAAVTEHEFNGKSVTKDNFIKVYSSAHLHAFTKANILAAFRKTGIYPFNPLVIMKAQIVRVCPRLGVYWCRRENGINLNKIILCDTFPIELMLCDS